MSRRDTARATVVLLTRHRARGARLTAPAPSRAPAAPAARMMNAIADRLARPSRGLAIPGASFFDVEPHASATEKAMFNPAVCAATSTSPRARDVHRVVGRARGVDDDDDGRGRGRGRHGMRRRSRARGEVDVARGRRSRTVGVGEGPETSDGVDVGGVRGVYCGVVRAVRAVQAQVCEFGARIRGGGVRGGGH